MHFIWYKMTITHGIICNIIMLDHVLVAVKHITPNMYPIHDHMHDIYGYWTSKYRCWSKNNELLGEKHER